MENIIEQVTLYFQEVPDWPLTLLGFVIVVAVVVEIINRRRRGDAVEYYDSVFLEELIGLYPIATRWPDNFVAFMQPRLPIMRDAFDNLRGFIPQDQLRDYNIVWNKFYEFSRTGRLEEADIHQESPEGTMTEEAQQLLLQQQRQQQQLIFQQLVSDLLSYTQQFKK
ncbi:hypothetical protein SAMN05421881_105820 [Nitrosomonas halophila]|uniref:Uncharacterized protein n=1 Tax=Nitrosomonas halophila TaxID=44576 RepID=A0A1H3MCC8_9PROT|nr:hypothetical protein SAMN05421881_105820 [Nitrosomonas halophila]